MPASATSTVDTVEKLERREKRRLKRRVLRSRPFGEYHRALAQSNDVRNAKLSADDLSGYRIRSDGATFHIASIPVELRGTPTFAVDTGNDWEASLVLRVKDDIVDANLVAERVAIDDTGGTVTVEQLQISEDGLESTVTEAEVSGDGPSAWETNFYRITEDGREPIFRQKGDNCDLCQDVFLALCSTGCSVSAGVPCALATGLAGIVICPIIVGLLCATFTVFADGCEPADITAEDGCEAIGYC